MLLSSAGNLLTRDTARGTLCGNKAVHQQRVPYLDYSIHQFQLIPTRFKTDYVLLLPHVIKTNRVQSQILKGRCKHSTVFVLNIIPQTLSLHLYLHSKHELVLGWDASTHASIRFGGFDNQIYMYVEHKCDEPFEKCKYRH